MKTKGSVGNVGISHTLMLTIAPYCTYRMEENEENQPRLHPENIEIPTIIVGISTPTYLEWAKGIGPSYPAWEAGIKCWYFNG